MGLRQTVRALGPSAAVPSWRRRKRVTDFLFRQVFCACLTAHLVHVIGRHAEAAGAGRRSGDLAAVLPCADSVGQQRVFSSLEIIQ